MSSHASNTAHPSVSSDHSQEQRPLDRLLAIMRRLRDPENGCPWDKAQTPASIAPYAVEEAYEVMDAIARDDRSALPDELGDLLFQVVFQAQMAQEAGLFDFEDVARTVADKMERRHPHIFGRHDHPDHHDDRPQVDWEASKAGERLSRAEYGALAGVALSLPALVRAEKLCRRAARVGFDWPQARDVLAALRSEIDELEAELDGDPDRMEDELGDVLFCAASLARKLAIDPERALRRSNTKFTRRFEAMEAHLAHDGKTVAGQDVETLERLWQLVKTRPGMR